MSNFFFSNTSPSTSRTYSILNCRTKSSLTSRQYPTNYINREILTKFYSVDLFLFLTTHQPLPQNGHFLLMTHWGLSLDQIVGSTEFNNVLFLIEPTILVSLILASQEISCPLFCSLLYFMQNIPISKTLFVITQLVWLKVSLVRSRPTNVRLARTLTLRVYPVLPVSNLLVLPNSFPWNSIFG